MSYGALKESVYLANMAVVEAGLVDLTWGNASGVDRERGAMVIKPSGVGYDTLTPDDMAVVDLETGDELDDGLRPSSDTPTHLYLYRQFEAIGGIVHTHSRYAVSWAQAEREIPCFGTTHADHFHGPVPVTRRMTPDEIRGEYERNTGAVIVERFHEGGIDAASVPGVLVAGHGPFVWGESAQKAAENAVALESVAEMALRTLTLNADARPIDRVLLDRHFLRKHGATAYYGQDQTASR